jgi:hypothetical protein
MDTSSTPAGLAAKNFAAVSTTLRVSSVSVMQYQYCRFPFRMSMPMLL